MAKRLAVIKSELSSGSDSLSRNKILAWESVCVCVTVYVYVARLLDECANVTAKIAIGVVHSSEEN